MCHQDLTHREEMRNSNIPKQEMPFLWERPVQYGSDLLRAIEVPVYQAGFQAPRGSMLVLGA